MERREKELEAGRAHRLRLRGKWLTFERDAAWLMRPTRVQLHGRDNSGTVTTTNETVETPTYVKSISFRVPVDLVDVEIVKMHEVPLPVHVHCSLAMMEPYIGFETVRPKGYILAVRRTNGPVLCCIDLGPNSNGREFVDLVRKAKTDAPPSPPNVVSKFDAMLGHHQNSSCTEDVESVVVCDPKIMDEAMRNIARGRDMED